MFTDGPDSFSSEAINMFNQFLVVHLQHPSPIEQGPSKRQPAEAAQDLLSGLAIGRSNIVNKPFVVPTLALSIVPS